MATWRGHVPSNADDGKILSGSVRLDRSIEQLRDDPIVFRFVPDVPRGAVITSATLNLVWSSGSTRFGVGVGAILRGDVPAITADLLSAPQTALVAYDAAGAPLRGTVVPVPVGSLVQQVVNHPDWQAGNGIALFAVSMDGNYPYLLMWDGSDPAYWTELVIEYQYTQYLHPVPIVVPAVVHPVGLVRLAVTQAAPITVPAVVRAVDVVAPRAIAAYPVRAPIAIHTPTMQGTGDAPPLDVAAPLRVPVTVGVPMLSLTIPPAPDPVPWERLVATDIYQAALTSRRPVTDARVEVINPDGAVIATLGGEHATHPGIVAGTVTCDGTASIRWTCDLTIDNPDLVPLSAMDLLHPLAHNRLRVWWRIRLPDGTWGEVPVGTFYPDWPEVTDTGDATVGLTVRGSDAVAEIKRATYDTSLNVGGLTASNAIGVILTDRAPWVQATITPTDHRLPAEYEAGEPGGDPWADVEKIAAAAGMVAYADRMGTIAVVPASDPLAPPRAGFVEGPGCAMTEVAASVDLDQVANLVTVAAQGATGQDPIVGRAQDDDPTSPLWVGHGHIYHRRVEVDEITAQAQADAYAAQFLSQRRALIDQVELVAFAHPHLDPGDVVTITRARAGVGGQRQVTSWSLALGDLSGMRITTAGRRGLT